MWNFLLSLALFVAFGVGNYWLGWFGHKAYLKRLEREEWNEARKQFDEEFFQAVGRYPDNEAVK